MAVLKDAFSACRTLFNLFWYAYEREAFEAGQVNVKLL